MRGGGKISCGSCGDALLGEAIKVATNLHYHVQCFLCTECGCELVNTGFFSKLAKYYCAEDYHSLFGTPCSLCHKYIEGEGLSVQGKGKSYHISCLACSKCGSRFDEGSRITFEKDQALCDTCKMSGVKSSASKHVCAACHKNIVGTSIYAMEKEWHMNCFTCQECDKPLTGEYMCKEGRPYCEEDYQDLYGQSCNICSEFILGKVLQAGGKSYHTSCLKCYICTKQFEEGQEIFMQDELFWHTDCDENVENQVEEKIAGEPPEKQPRSDPPELVIPPPPSATPPPDTPVEQAPELPPRENSPPPSGGALAVGSARDRRTKSATSIASDYEELTVLQEAGKQVIYDSDFEENLAPAKPARAASIKSNKSITSAKSTASDPPQPEIKESVTESVTEVPEEETPTATTLSPDITSDIPIDMPTEAPVDDDQVFSDEIPATEETKQEDSATALVTETDTVTEPVPEEPSTEPIPETQPTEPIPETQPTEPIPEPVVGPASVSESLPEEPSKETPEEPLKEPEKEPESLEPVPYESSRRSVSSLADSQISRSVSVVSERDEEGSGVEEERLVSVKDMLKRAKSIEQENLLRRPVPVHRVPSTASSETSERASEASETPSKPPRVSATTVSSTPVARVAPVSKVQGGVDTTPSASIRGLKQVDSPIIKIIDEVDIKDDAIDYLDFKETYDIGDLQSQKFRLPPGIDRSQLQQYLSDEQFQSLFKMSSLKFDTLPKWKKTTLKKGLNLF